MSTTLKSVAALFILILISSCQKELSFETGLEIPGGGSNNGTAKFSFKGAPAECTDAGITGNYKTGTALSSSNTVTVKVIVDSLGTYSITTNISNGISFTAAGSFTTIGEQTITLTGSGTPSAAGVYNFIPGTNGCTFNITVTGDTVPLPVDECKSCTYIPVCVGSKYTYEINNGGVETTLVEELLSPETDTTVNGIVYRKIEASYNYSNGTSARNFAYYNCSNNTTTVFAYQVANIGGTATINFIKSTILKANEPVLTTWTDVITNQAGVPVTMTFTLKEKNVSRNVLGKSFDSVMHVSYIQKVDFLGNEIEAGTGDYYYAKNVGLIENSSVTLGKIGTWKLKDYFIP
jgi:hypothetical protein